MIKFQISNAVEKTWKFEIGNYLKLVIIPPKAGGQSLVEVVVALGVVVALAMALITTSLMTQRASRTAQSSTQATKLVQQNIERLRVFRDRNGFSELASGTYRCIRNTDLDPSDWVLEASFVNCPVSGVISLGNVDFTSEITISTPAVNKKQVVVRVQWADPGGIQSVTNTTFLSNCVDPSGC